MKKFKLDRRTVLKGAGVTLALPMLEAMMSKVSFAQATEETPFIINCVWANGLPGFYESNEGDTTNNRHNTYNSVYRWKCYPEYAINHYLDRLSPDAKKMSSVVPNSLHNWGATGHDSMSGLFAGGVSQIGNISNLNRQGGNPNIFKIESYDQKIARHFGLKTLNAMSTKGYYGNPFVNEAQGRSLCDTISWRRYYNSNGQHDGTHRAIDMYDQPADIYDLIVGQQNSNDNSEADKVVRRRLLMRKDTILSNVMEGITKLNKNLGNSDKQILEEYLQGIREIDRGIASDLDAINNSGSSVPKVCNAPFGKPGNISQYDFTYETMHRRTKLFQDLYTIAMECDLYQVFGLNQVGRASGVRMNSNDPGSLSWHSVSHWRFVDGGATNEASASSQEFQRKRYADFALNEITLFADWMNTLAAKKQANGKSLLQRVSAVLTTDLSEGNSHLKFGIPVFLAGAANGKIPNHNGHQFHLNKACTWDEGIPIGNLWLSLAQQLGLNESKIGESTGLISGFNQSHS